ncbi:V-type ATP synthase subunit E family protein [Sediminispirochaeta smaragdinae]|jgi:vacuolar-type H+-ATPase subunit H|uniref:Uncharacterized protein n=1 Tax=Sediminispirochaeta smaragdinae (strain DSM 11293 / JCM 15392 / SEBR 4228) TaxID=573413 RepID=E1R4X4_SEDSS|nr:hypothetical protein [Sediminispirochaeta smaragdinae]ADK82212.1 hypothetical protein Spirs_3114 [Sediminispirochaeta smaragdinae DSM 11293]
MKELIERVLETEKNAAGRVENARSESARIQSEADQKAASIIDEARAEASRRIDAAVKAAESEAHSIRDQRLQATDEDIEAYRKRVEGRFDLILDEAVKLIIHGRGE